jgi:hypothetical protein
MDATIWNHWNASSSFHSLTSLIPLLWRNDLQCLREVWIKVKNIFKKFKEFQKCDVARPSNNNKPHHAAVEYNAVAPAEHEPGAVSVHPAFGSSVDASSIESGYEDHGSTAPTGYMPDTNTQESIIVQDNTIFTSQNDPVDCSLDKDDLDFDEGENNDFNDLKILPMLHRRSAGVEAGC